MADKKLKVVIITPNQILFSGDADLVNVPGSLSPFEILYNHAPIVSALDRGKIRVFDKKEGENIFLTSEGFVEVSNNKVSILVERAENFANLTIKDIENNINKIKTKLLNPELNEAEKHSLQKELIFEEYCQKILNSIT